MCLGSRPLIFQSIIVVLKPCRFIFCLILFSKFMAWTFFLKNQLIIIIYNMDVQSIDRKQRHLRRKMAIKYLGQVPRVAMSCYLVLLSFDCKTRLQNRCTYSIHSVLYNFLQFLRLACFGFSVWKLHENSITILYMQQQSWLRPRKNKSTDVTLQWRQNGHDNVSNHQPHDCLLNRLFRRRSKKTSKLRVTGLCAGNSPGTGEFPAQMASYAENVSIWWGHHGDNNESYNPRVGLTRPTSSVPFVFIIFQQC